MAERTPLQSNFDVVIFGMAEDTEIAQSELKPQASHSVSRRIFLKSARNIALAAAASFIPSSAPASLPQAPPETPRPIHKDNGKEKKAGATRMVDTTGRAEVKVKAAWDNSLKGQKIPGQEAGTPLPEANIPFPELDFSASHLPSPELKPGENNAEALYERILNNDTVRNHVDTLLEAQADVYKVLPKLGIAEKDVPMFMPIVWMWSESGDYQYPNKEGYPNVYGIRSEEFAKVSVGTFFKVRDGERVQIGGAQLMDSIKKAPNIRTLLIAFYGSDSDSINGRFQKLIDESQTQDISEWNYHYGDLTPFMAQFLTPDRTIKPEIQFTPDNIAASVPEFNNDGKSQFATLLAMKDPAVSYALNIHPVRDWLLSGVDKMNKTGDPVGGYITPEKAQRMSNMLYAVYKRYQDLRRDGTLDATLDGLYPVK